MVSDALEIEGPPELYASSTSLGEWLACSTSHCMAFARDYGGDVSKILASSVSASGILTDLPRRILPDAQIFAVVGRGDEFLVFTWDSGAVTHHYRLKADGGAVEEVTAELDVVPQAGIGVGDKWVFVDYVGGGYRVTVFDSNLEHVGAPIDVVTTQPTAPALIAGDGQVLVAWDEGALRVDLATGAPLDANAIRYSRYKKGVPAGVYRNGIYQLAFPIELDTGIYGSRIRASDGVVLDPDDTFNQVSGAKLLCDRCFGSWNNSTPPRDSVHLYDIGTATLLTWHYTLGLSNLVELHGATVDGSTGLRADGIGDAGELNLGAVSYENEVFLKGSSGIVRSDQEVFALSIDTSGTLPASRTVPQPISPVSETRTAPAVASDGTGFLVTWVRAGRIFMTRMDGNSGAYLDDPPIEIGSGSGPAVEYGGSHYLVAWVDESFRILSRPVSSDGTIGQALAMPAYHDYETRALKPSRLELTWNGRYHLATWFASAPFSDSGLRARRLEPSGAAVGTDFVQLTQQGVGSDYAVVADVEPAEDRRTFLVAFGTPQGVGVRRFRSDSGVVVNPITQLSGDGFGLLSGVRSGNDLWFFYSNPDYTARAVKVDAIEGTPVAPATDLFRAERLFLEQVTHDGRSLLALTIDERPGYGVRRFTDDFAPLESAKPRIGTRLTGDANMTSQPNRALASNGSGKSLFVYQVLDPNRMGLSLRARLVQNDGLPAPATAEGGAGGESGVGEGGDAGMGGAAGNDGGMTGEGNSAGTIAGGTHQGGSNSAGNTTQGGTTQGGTTQGGTTQGGGMPSGGTPTSGGTTSGGASAEAGAPPEPGGDDAGGASGASGEEDSGNDSGCGCRVPGSRAPEASWAALLAAFVLVRRRRGRRTISD